MLGSDAEMLRSKRLFFTLVCAVMAIPALKLLGSSLDDSGVFIQAPVAREIRAGEVMTLTGRALDSAHIKAIYLNDGHTDFKVQILDQGSGSVRFRVPVKTPAGKMHFGIVPANREDVIDEPVYLKVLPALGVDLV